MLNRRITKNIINFIVDNAKSRLEGQTASKRSLVGCVTLVKYVLASLLNFIMQTIPFTKSICQEIDKHMNDSFLG